MIVFAQMSVQRSRFRFLAAFGHRLNLRFVLNYVGDERPRWRRLKPSERNQRDGTPQAVSADLKLGQLAFGDFVAHRPGGKQRHADAAFDHSFDEERVVRYQLQVGSHNTVSKEVIRLDKILIW